MVLKPRMESPDWNDGKCSPEKGLIDINKEDIFFEDEDAAVEFCRGDECDIINECLIWSLINNCAIGVYGGTSELDRKAIRKRWPLRRGYKVDGKTKWDAREEWDVFDPGEPQTWFEDTDLRQELDEEMGSDSIG